MAKQVMPTKSLNAIALCSKDANPLINFASSHSSLKIYSNLNILTSSARGLAMIVCFNQRLS
jgi:hypothetical protein